MEDDPDGPFGARCYTLTLSEAIDRGICAPYQVVCLDITDTQLQAAQLLGADARSEEVRGARLAALQTALVKAAAEEGFRRTLVFHHVVKEAEAFAAGLPDVAERLHDVDPELYPGTVWAEWLCGEHKPGHRRRVLAEFADGIAADGTVVEKTFLSSVRILGEGVDITGERGVEAICFADTRGSQVEIVQNIGRALRLNRDGSTKVARIIVPVFLEPGEDPTDMVASASFRPLVAVLQGLRSHDERLVEQLASRALTSGERKVHVRRDEDGRIVGAGGVGDGEEQGHDDIQAAAESALLHFSTPRDAATIAAFLRTRVYRPESLVWLEGYQALLRWREGERDHRPPRRPLRHRGRSRGDQGVSARAMGPPAEEGAAGRRAGGAAQDAAGRAGGWDGVGTG
jgi:predicted helicase